MRMEYTQLPNIQKKVSKIGMGAWAIGGGLWGGTDEKESIQSIHKGFEQGITLIDTAPAYGKGQSEILVGKALKSYGKRDEIVVATKAGLNQETEGVFRDSRRKSLLKEVEDSLRRLQIEKIDLYQIHWPDTKTAISETAATLKELLDQGKIGAIGVSNYTLKQIEEFRKTAPLHTVQSPFNLFEQEIEKEILPYCLKNQIGTLGYGSLCRGLLSGAMYPGRQFKGDDLRGSMDPKFKEPRFSQYLKCVQHLNDWVQKRYQRPIIALAVRWVLDKGITVPLWGVRKPSQLDPIPLMFGWKLTEEDFKEIEQIIITYVVDPIGPDFMSPPERKENAS